MKKKILIIAAFPPPVTGSAVASEKIVNVLSTDFNFMKIDYARRNLKTPLFDFKQALNSIKRIYTIRKESKFCDLSYLVVSQSLLGNFKDLLFLIAIKNKNIIIHLHGGGIKKLIYDKYPIIKQINKLVFKKVRVAIVLSDSLVDIYKDFLPKNRIKIVPNFVDSKLIIDKKLVSKKIESNKKRILYLSNLLPGKGYIELIEAYLQLEKSIQNNYYLDFAGDFANDQDKTEFLYKISLSNNIFYHGVVSGKEKKNLYENASIFCLPSYYRYYEGQPISILEAYASGCIVLTTNHGGIKDIFQDKVNGFEVEKASVKSLRKALCSIDSLKPEELLKIAVHNIHEAETKYNEDIFISNIYDNIVENLDRI